MNPVSENMLRLRRQKGMTQAELAEKAGQKTGKPAKKVPKPKAVSNDSELNRMYCPECGEPLVFEEGCNICKACGWSKCL